MTKLFFYSGHCEIVGGDAKYVFELINQLDPQKYDVRLYTDANPVFAERAKQWLTRPIPIHYLDTRPVLFAANTIDAWIKRLAGNADGSSKKLHDLLTYSVKGVSLARLLRILFRALVLGNLRGHLHNYQVFKNIFLNEKPDIFHFNNGGYPGKTAGIMALVAAQHAGIKNTVMTIQNLPQKKIWCRVSDYLFDLWTRKYCRRIITVSEKLRQFMAVERGYPLTNAVTIFHGLSDVAHLPADQILEKKRGLGLSDDTPVLLITANLDEDRKGHAVLFQALTFVKREFQKIILLVVGDGTRRKDFEALSVSLGLEEHVRFLGHRTDITELNDMIDIACVPSIAFEGIPYTIREAMRSAKPVITTDAGGCDEAVEHGVSGFIVKQNDARELADALLKLLRDPVLLKSMGKESRRLFEQKFLLGHKVAEHEILYQEFRPAQGGCCQNEKNDRKAS